VGVQADEVEGDCGEQLLEVDFAQAAVAGVAGVADRDGLADGAFDAGAQGVGGLSGCGVLDGAGLALSGVYVMGVHGELAARCVGGGALLAHWAGSAGGW
jgi:hypothetical protein